MNVSSIGSSGSPTSPVAAAGTSSKTTSSDSTNFNDGISLSNDADNVVQDDTSNYTLGSNADWLFYNLNAGILGPSADLAGVQSAIDTYTQSLPSSNVYDSSYTAPSAQFLSDLTALKNDAATGNLATAQTDLAQAKEDAPDNVADGMADAKAKGDTAGYAALMVEATENMSDALAAYGSTPSAAADEANAITINGLVGTSNSDAQAMQTRLDQIVDLATGLASSTASSGHGAAITSSNPLLNVIEELLQNPSAAASNQTLAQLDQEYGSSSASSSAPANTTA